MDEQSHKDDMRAALRGDFDRLRARQGSATVATTSDPSSVGSVPIREPATAARELSGAERRGSWVDRLFGRG